MKKTIVLIAAIALAGCETAQERAEYQITQNGLPVVTIEDCQYFVFTGYAGSLSYEHKGNCNNPSPPKQ